ncbi:MAG TPA: GNAT family N-acetyltransferase [Thermomicrobiales bacterium]|jgi:ribosomal protein S18 acetylase RimI-like enzyme|nr:GNAT family N-acetyltransferase [Thermomicrobiales bacterium]
MTDQTDDTPEAPRQDDASPSSPVEPGLADPEAAVDGLDDQDDDDQDDDVQEDERTLRIGLAQPEQAEALLALLQRAFAEQSQLDPPTGVSGETVDDIAATIESGQTIVGVLDGELIATVRYAITADSVYLGRLAVDPDYRRNGIATMMLEWVRAELLPAEGKQAIDVEVRAALPGNIRLFRDLGFRELGRYPHPKNHKSSVIKLRWRQPPPAKGRRGR